MAETFSEPRILNGEHATASLSNIYKICRISHNIMTLKRILNMYRP